VDLARELRIQRLQSLGGLEQQWRGGATPIRVKTDLRAEDVHLGALGFA
jgi:hypothetical protein